jgi:hypothetical protein
MGGATRKPTRFFMGTQRFAAMPTTMCDCAIRDRQQLSSDSDCEEEKSVEWS